MPMKCIVDCNSYVLAQKRGASKQRAERHADTQHRGLRYPCPLAEDKGCDKAEKHANSIHCGLKVPCPLAEEEECDKTFYDKWYAERHADKAHRGVRKEILCTMAEEYGCTRTFCSIQKAKHPADSVHLGLKLPYPFAKEFGCKQTFSRPSSVAKHAFAHKFKWRCVAPMCLRAITKQLLNSETIRLHMKRHDEKGQLKGLSPYPKPLTIALDMNEEQGGGDGEEGDVMDVDYNSDVEDNTDFEDDTNFEDDTDFKDDADLTLSGEAMFSNIMDMKAREESVRKRNAELQKCKTCAELLSSTAP